MDNDKIKVCVICKEEFTGWGNNPAPIKDEGECCDTCDNEKVIPARIEGHINN